MECDSGYELAGGGSNVATCLATGNWDTLPICDPKGKDYPSEQSSLLD